MTTKRYNLINRKLHMDGFTLIELLVVISIIAVLMAIMMPSLRKVREAGKKILCSANSRGIMNSMLMYVHDYGKFHPAFNGPLWFNSSNMATHALEPDQELGLNAESTLRAMNPAGWASGNAQRKWCNDSMYWGTAYIGYGATKEQFKCPSQKKIYENYWEAGDTEKGKIALEHSSYSLNGFICWEAPERIAEDMYRPGDGKRRYEHFKRPSEVIAFHDGYEAVIEDNYDGDMYYCNPKANVNIWQWKKLDQEYSAGGQSKYTGLIKENYWRHDGSGNIVWLDGHASNLKETDCARGTDREHDVRYEWYSGGLTCRK